MKKIIKYTVLMLVLIAFSTSCKDDFLETAPSTSIGEKMGEGTSIGLNAILEGMHYMNYSYGFGQGFGFGQTSISAQLDMLGDDFINTKPAYYMGVYRWQYNSNPNGGINYKIWDYYYTIILHANKLIKGVNNLKDITDNDRNTLLGEGYAFRAWAYFNLVQIFGKRYVKGEANDQLGVIIRNENQLQDPLPRSTVAEVYKYIDENMQMSLEHLKKAPDKKIKNAIRYATACGIASRIALAKQEWAEAEKYATEAIAKSGATLQVGGELIDGFNNMRATEWMWAYTQNPNQDFYFGGFFGHYSYNFDSHWIGGIKYAVNRTIYDKMGKKDVRRKWWVAKDQNDQIPEDAASVYFEGGMSDPKWEYTGNSIKFKAASANSTRGDVQVMRLAEMYYNKAEAQARQGKDAEAQATLNEVVKTRDEDYNTTAAGTDLIDEVMRNKRIDLWMEGFRFFDMKRLGIVPDRLSAANFNYLTEKDKEVAIKRNSGDNAKFIPKTADDKAWQFAIPYSEIKGNKLCEQNPL